MSARPRYGPGRLALWLKGKDGWNELKSAQWAEREEQNWARKCHLPEGLVLDWLRCAIDCRCVGQDGHAEVFLRRAIQSADRLIGEGRLRDTEVAEAGFPCSLGEVMRGRAYALWLSGAPLDRSSLREAAEHLLIWCLTKAEDHKRFIHNFTMDYYLTAVRCVLIAGDVPRARELLATKQRFLFHHLDEKLLWRRFVEALPGIDGQLRDDYVAFFDLVRDPHFECQGEIGWIPVRHEWLALDMAIIRQMYLLNSSPADPVDPEAVIDDLAY